jgi:hypothetical protein
VNAERAPAQPAARPPFLNADAASRFLGGVKSARWLKDEARAGRIKAHRLGQTYFWTEQILLELVAENFCDPGNYGRKPSR